MVAEPPCYTVVNEAIGEYPSASDLRNSLQKGSDEVKLDTLRKIIVSTINGNHQVRFVALRAYDAKQILIPRTRMH